MGKERFALKYSLVCLVSFLMVMRLVSQDYIMCDDFTIDSSLSIVVKKIKIIL